MRRPNSSSCLLLPKGSFATTSNTDVDDPSSVSPSNGPTSSVTIMSKQKLPSYGCERFWMLSELQQGAHSVRFLGEWGTNGVHDDAENEEEQSDPMRIPSPRDILMIQQDSNHQRQSSAPFLILYLLWGPEKSDPASNVSSSSSKGPSAFVETVVLPAVNTIQQYIHIKQSDSTSTTLDGHHHNHHLQSPTSPGFRRAASFASSSMQSNKQEPLTTSASASTSAPNLPSASLYLVIDRVQSGSHDENDNHRHHRHADGDPFSFNDDSEEKLAEHLARNVATHSILRGCVEGVTVGVSNHVRAAPGLEAIVHAVTLGSSDRRKHATTTDPFSYRSLLGIVAPTSDDLLGLQNSHCTDAVQGISQYLITAEWNGRGNLRSFARRAQAQWNRHHNIPDHYVKALQPEVRSPPRRIRRTRQVFETAYDRVVASGRRAARRMMTPTIQMHTGKSNNNATNDKNEQQWWDLVASILILAYIAFHCPQERKEIMNWISYLADKARDQITAAR